MFGTWETRKWHLKLTLVRLQTWSLTALEEGMKILCINEHIIYYAQVQLISWKKYATSFFSWKDISTICLLKHVRRRESYIHNGEEMYERGTEMVGGKMVEERGKCSVYHLCIPTLYLLSIVVGGSAMDEKAGGKKERHTCREHGL